MAGAVPIERGERYRQLGDHRRIPTWRWAPLLLVLSAASACRTPAPDPSPSDADEEPQARAAPVARPAPGFHPIVDAVEGQLFGAASDGHWLDAGSAAPRIDEGMTYQLYALSGGIGERQGGVPLPPDETCANPGVQIGDPPTGEQDVIAVGGPWNAIPRPVSEQSTDQAVYRDFVAGWLREHGIDPAVVRVDQILRVDLFGDGADEVLLSANLLRGAGTSAQPGDYSVVLLRQVVDGEVQTASLAEEYYPDGCMGDCAPAEHRVAAVLDLNGDGVMEVVLAWRDYEGRGKTVHRVDGPRVEEVLSWHCAP